MLIRYASLSMLIILAAGGTCTFTPGPNTTVDTLDRADGDFTITQAAGSNNVDVELLLTDSFGAAFETVGDQAISVNDRELAASQTDAGIYERTIPAADSYRIRVTEPTRGVETTDITAPASFRITSPARGADASLSGFTLDWTGADNAQDVMLTLQQTILGEDKMQEFGPFTDEGTLDFSARDLRQFRQGAPLFITITKTRTANAVNGLRNARVTIDVSKSTRVNPAP